MANFSTTGSDTHPAGMILAKKSVAYAITSTNYIATNSTTWVGTTSSLNITHALESSNNILLFTVSSGQPYVPTGSNYYYVGIAKTTDTTGSDANIIRYGSDASNGRIHNIKAYNTELTGLTCIFKYAPGATTSFTYQPIQKVASATTGYLTNNSDSCNLVFTLEEIQV